MSGIQAAQTPPATRSTSPCLLVTAHTATGDIHPPVSLQAINKPLRAHGHQAGRLRVDRILDHAQHTDYPRPEHE
ncbi:hypothetical protein [Streptomyces sviceus]|uniref:hypothetical protein n=1 Tax=Streptomyces sviceus TaxID=285530 RepID=UPI00332579A8